MLYFVGGGGGCRSRLPLESVLVFLFISFFILYFGGGGGGGSSRLLLEFELVF